MGYVYLDYLKGHNKDYPVYTKKNIKSKIRDSFHVPVKLSTCERDIG